MEPTTMKAIETKGKWDQGCLHSAQDEAHGSHERLKYAYKWRRRMLGYSYTHIVSGMSRGLNKNLRPTPKSLSSCVKLLLRFMFTAHFTSYQAHVKSQQVLKPIALAKTKWRHDSQNTCHCFIWMYVCLFEEIYREKLTSYDVPLLKRTITRVHKQEPNIKKYDKSIPVCHTSNKNYYNGQIKSTISSILPFLALILYSSFKMEKYIFLYKCSGVLAINMQYINLY